MNRLTGKLRDACLPVAQKEYTELTAFAAANGHAGTLEPWDLSFWQERQREQLYQYTEEELRPYFSLPNVLEGLFKLTERLFGVRVVPADVSQAGVDLWHPDCQFFDIYSGSEKIASFYLDPYSRPAEKNGGAWMNVCRQKSGVLERNPVAYLICNGTAPVGEQPSLMTFSEVTTLFHEFGHGIQHMLTTVNDSQAVRVHLLPHCYATTRPCPPPTSLALSLSCLLSTNHKHARSYAFFRHATVVVTPPKK